MVNKICKGKSRLIICFLFLRHVCMCQRLVRPQRQQHRPHRWCNRSDDYKHDDDDDDDVVQWDTRCIKRKCIHYRLYTSSQPSQQCALVKYVVWCGAEMWGACLRTTVMLCKTVIEHLQCGAIPDESNALPKCQEEQVATYQPQKNCS